MSILGAATALPAAGAFAAAWGAGDADAADFDSAGFWARGHPGRQERGEREPADFQDMTHLQFPPVFRDAEALKPSKFRGYFRKPSN